MTLVWHRRSAKLKRILSPRRRLSAFFPYCLRSLFCRLFFFFFFLMVFSLSVRFHFSNFDTHNKTRLHLSRRTSRVNTVVTGACILAFVTFIFIEIVCNTLRHNGIPRGSSKFASVNFLAENSAKQIWREAKRGKILGISLGFLVSFFKKWNFTVVWISNCYFTIYSAY